MLFLKTVSSVHGQEFRRFYETLCSLPCSQKPAIGFSSAPDESRPHSKTLLFITTFVWSHFKFEYFKAADGDTLLFTFKR
jgi:hypothetical protein